jgi:hypothetical protein
VPDSGWRQEFLYKVLIVLGFVLLGALRLQALSVIPLVFGAVLVALLFRSLAEPLARWSGLPESMALTASVLLVFPPDLLPDADRFSQIVSPAVEGSHRKGSKSRVHLALQHDRTPYGPIRMIAGAKCKQELAAKRARTIPSHHQHPLPPGRCGTLTLRPGVA